MRCSASPPRGPASRVNVGTPRAKTTHHLSPTTVATRDAFTDIGSLAPQRPTQKKKKSGHAHTPRITRSTSQVVPPPFFFLSIPVNNTSQGSSVCGTLLRHRESPIRVAKSRDDSYGILCADRYGPPQATGKPKRTTIDNCRRTLPAIPGWISNHGPVEGNPTVHHSVPPGRCCQRDLVINPLAPNVRPPSTTQESNSYYSY